MTGRAEIDITVRIPDVVASPDGRQMLMRAEIVISIQRRVPGQPENTYTLVCRPRTRCAFSLF